LPFSRILALRTTYETERKPIVMHNEFTAIIERDGETFIAFCPEIPGANGQGETVEDCIKILRSAIELILTDRRADALRGLPADALRNTVALTN
jgi:predicted RNase H-like HicB family nuclease